MLRGPGVRGELLDNAPLSERAALRRIGTCTSLYLRVMLAAFTAIHVLQPDDAYRKTAALNWI